MSDPSVETIARRLVGRYWLDAWTLCPAGVPQQVDFDPDAYPDVAPWTVDQVRKTVGYVVLRFNEIDRWGGPLAGDLPDGTHSRYTFTRTWLEFQILTPSAVDAALAETYAARIEELFAGVTLRNEDPLVVIRQLSSENPVRRRSGIDDGSFRTLFVDVKVERRERTALAGAKEVTP